MKFGIQTWGSNGDIRPMLALAHGLHKAGHNVTLAVSSIDNKSYADICRQLDIRYVQIPERIEFDLQDFAQRTLRVNTLTWLRALLDEAYFPYEQAIYETAQQLVRDNDCVIGHHFLYPLKLAAERGQKPFFSVTFCHAAIPVVSQPPFRFPNFGLRANKIAWKALDAIFNWALMRPLTRLWQAESGGPVENVLTGLLTSQQLNLVAVDPLFCPLKEQWTSNHYACGFLNLTEDAHHWTIPNDLQRFLDTGAPPVYMTFGSLQQAVPEWSMDLFVEATQLAGHRAIIQTSSERYPAGSCRDDVYFIGKHPHQPLFKRCAAVVHHGGAGTTHAALLGGCASVVVPFMDEQLFWARQLQILGVADIPLPARKVTARSLAQAVLKTLASATISRQAYNCGSEMRRHDGVAQAVRMIESRMKAYYGLK
ncbi:MAG: glycosyltransferase [Gammaproteobacteria bacterium]